MADGVRPLVPPSHEVKPYVSVIGEEATLRLVEAFGGSNVYVAAKPDEDSVVAKAIGLDAARLLGAGLWGGDRIKPPVARAWKVQLLHARGLTTAEIVRRVGVDRSTVQRILRGTRDTKQLYLQFAEPTP